MKRSTRLKTYFASMAIASMAFGGTPASWAAALDVGVNESPSVLIGSVSGDTLGEVLTRSESLNGPGDLEAFLKNVLAQAEDGNRVSVLGLHEKSPESVVELISDARESLVQKQPFSEEVLQFKVLPDSSPSPVRKAKGFEAGGASDFSTMSATDPSTPADYDVWGAAFNANHSWKWDNEYKIEDCWGICEVVDKLTVTTVVDPGQTGTRLQHNQVYFPNTLGYFHSPEVRGKIYLPTAPAVVQRDYTLVSTSGVFIYNHVNTDGKKFIMGMRLSVPTDGGDDWVLKPRTLTATCGTNIDGFCQWWV